MLTGIHVLLTYTCTFACDHCFLYCSPSAEGVFSMHRLRQLLQEAKRMGTIKTFFFEGGEPFLFHPILLEAVKEANLHGFTVGIVSNAYWATTVEDAKIWLNPLKDRNICNISISDDAFHFGTATDRPPLNARKAAEELELPVSVITIEQPSVKTITQEDEDKRAPVVGGGTQFRGRAVEKLTAGLPTRACSHFRECPHEDLVDPGRVHIDPFGNVFVCQGLSIGNCFETPLSDLMSAYDPQRHPIVGPIVAGGPHRLAKEHEADHEEEYIDECHMCYTVRKRLKSQFPQYLTPDLVYGK